MAKANKVEIKFIKLPVVHFKNPKNPKRTICGHDNTISGRSYSNVTQDRDDVTCKGCLNALKGRKWLKQKRRNKNPKEMVNAILAEVAKSS